MSAFLVAKDKTMSKCCQLFSGSKGNSIYIACGDAKFLVDAGVSAKRITQGLEQIGVDASELDAIFITHEHSDHINGIKVFAKKHKLPIYAHGDVIAKMIYNDCISDEISAIAIDSPITINNTEIIPFENSHDSIACYGYRFNMSDKRSISVCTDTGYVTDSAREALMGTDLIFLESNHEVSMLQNGPYNYILKQRILSPKGHLSNFAASEFAVELVKNGTTRIVLSHLSQENNLPDLARQTTLSALTQNGYNEGTDYRLYVSPQENTERPIVL